jgi:hypothetical protein
MTDGQVIGFVVLSPTLAIAAWLGLRYLLNLIDRNRPRQQDWVAEHKRRIARNGFKSRMGAR